jgi:microcystin-dependent protein
VLGQAGGTANVTLLQNQLPQHNHTFNATRTNAAAATLPGNLPATPTVNTPNPPYLYANQGTNPPLNFVPMAAGACGTTGQSQGHSNLMPSLTINFCIALQGIFPSRN